MKKILLSLLIAISMATLMSCTNYDDRSVIVSKEQFRLYVLENGDTLWSAPVGVGLNYGNKEEEGDMRTPEGIFEIVSIEKASHWTHDFGDGYGEREGAYGDWFIRLEVPGFSGIGIHGTCFPESIGTRCTEGCIRLHNSDLKKLHRMIRPGIPCTIEPDPILDSNLVVPTLTTTSHR